MQIIQHRRALHQIPELDRDLPETMAYLRKVLTPLGCTLSSPIPGALCAFFDFGRADAIAFDNCSVRNIVISFKAIAIYDNGFWT